MPRKAGRPSRQYLEDTKRMQEKRNLREVGMLTGGQAKIAAKAPPPNKIDEKDLAVLRAEKAKGRGMGLQDEKVQPGKVMKARVGKSIDAKKYMKSIGVFPKVSSGAGGKGSGTGGRDTRTITEKGQFIKRRKELGGLKKLGRVAGSRAGAIGAILGAGAVGLNMAGRKLKKVLDERKARKRDEAKVGKMGGGMMMKYSKGGGYDSGKVMKAKRGVFSSGKISDMSFDEKMKRVESGQINKKTGKFTSMNAMRDAKGFQKGESAAEFNKRRMKLAGAKKALSATRIGKIVLPIAAAGVAAQQYLKSKMKKKDEPKKKMGGGMMKKYSKGGGLDMGGGRAKGLIPQAQEKAKSMTVKSSKRIVKKMGGGMMQKPIGYKSGMGPAGAGVPSAGRPSGRRPMTQGPKKRDGSQIIVMTKDGPKRITIGRSELDNMSAIEQKMGGGMIAPSQRPGYSKGTMVKARGCKLGRTRPTKIT